MAISEITSTPVPIKLWTPLHEVESEALDQLKNVARLPWIYKHVAVMPDVHAGKGCTVGSVIAMKEALAPAAVGVDIGCGMGAIMTTLRAKDLPDNLDAIRSAIEAAIPVGFNRYDHTLAAVNAERGFWSAFRDLRMPNAMKLFDRAKHQCGTLGGGNHFIELCLDTYDRVWIMLHSGSRNIGKELAEYHIGVAKKLLHNATIPDPDMAVFLSKTPEMEAYRNDLYWAQRYAFLNRHIMMDRVREVLGTFFADMLVEVDSKVLCHHNYVAEEVHYGEKVYVTRKGAIHAGKGIMGIIPGSMGTRSYIVRGLGSEESFCSASHGAGRVMSRGKAKRTFTQADLEAQTAGVCCRKDSGVIDEIPGAYKNIDKVIANEADLVEVVHTLKQVLCVKG